MVVLQIKHPQPRGVSAFFIVPLKTPRPAYVNCFRTASSKSSFTKLEKTCRNHQGTLASMYQHGPSYNRGFLGVSETHTIYYELFGNPAGEPAVFLHGGPGAGCFPRHANFFDPQHYRVVLFDQRGCGKSTPRGCIKENTTWDLVEDLEKLRRHLQIKKWLVMGGSWGVTLGLAYGQAYPDAVSGFILRGVCMLRQEEIDWFYNQGANKLFPFAWEELVNILDPSERTDVIPAFYKRLTSNDPELRSQAARAWLRWEMGLSFFSTSKFVYAWDGKQYSTHSLDETNYKEDGSASKGARTGNNKETKIPVQNPANRGQNLMFTTQEAQALLECHYFINGGFLEENQLLNCIHRIRHIPCVIVQGRYDFVCPIKNAFDLHRAWPEAKMCIVSNAGHSMYESGITKEIIGATEQFKSVNC